MSCVPGDSPVGCAIAGNLPAIPPSALTIRNLSPNCGVYGTLPNPGSPGLNRFDRRTVRVEPGWITNWPPVTCSEE